MSDNPQVVLERPVMFERNSRGMAGLLLFDKPKPVFYWN